MLRALYLFFLLLAACAAQPMSTPLAPTPTSVSLEGRKTEFNNTFAGWAYEAYPEASLAKMAGDFALMRANGANAVWIGHNNPGQVDAGKVEPGLSYAVYAAIQNDQAP